MIGVKNHSGAKLVAKYAGKEFSFEADENVTTPLGEDAARHIFGYGEQDKTRALLRLGWLSNGSTLQTGLDKLSQFQFLAVEDIKFKETEATMELPRSVASSAPADGMPLSEGELAIGEKLNKPQGKEKQFAQTKK